MTTTGPNSFGTAADDGSFGDYAWQNPSNAVSSNNSYATVNIDTSRGPGSSHYLKGTNAGLSIPSGDTIVGIQIDAEQKVSASSTAYDYSVKLVKGGTISGSNLATSAFVSTTEAYVTWGGATQLWGLSWTPADINASNFGAAIAYRADTGSPTVSVDHMRGTVYHTAGSGAPVTATSFFLMM